MSDRLGRSAADLSAVAPRLLRLAAVGLIALAVLLVALITAGVFDPKPLGASSRIDQPGQLSLSGAAETTLVQSPPWSPEAPPDGYSLRLTAAHATGEMDSSYGLALGNEADGLVVAVSPLGYVAVRQTVGGGVAYPMPWQTWPHVRPGAAENEIWLDVERAAGRVAVTAWVNREQLWRGEFDRLPGDVGLWLGSFGGPVEVDFRRLEWFSDASDSAPTAEN